MNKDFEILRSFYHNGVMMLLSLVNDAEGTALMWTNHRIHLEPGQKIPLRALKDMFQKDHNRQCRHFIAESKKNKPKEPRGSKRIMDITREQYNGMFKR